MVHLNQDYVGFVLYDSRICAVTKENLVGKMSIAISKESFEDKECVPKNLTKTRRFKTRYYQIRFNHFGSIIFSNYEKIHLYKRFNISEMDPRSWTDSEEYRNGKHIFENLKIVNDCAESKKGRKAATVSF